MGRRRELADLRALQRQVWGRNYSMQRSTRVARLRRGIGFAVAAMGIVFVVLGIASPGAHATPPNPEHKVTLCHRTDSYTNPYVRITVDVASVLHEGHDSHDGPVFFPTIPKHEKWGDIIPPFNFGPRETYAGKNWTDTGMTVFNNDCVMPFAAPPPTSTPPPTSAPGGTTTTVGSGSTTTTPGESTTGPTETTNPQATTTTIGSEASTTTVSSNTTSSSPTGGSTTALAESTTVEGAIETPALNALATPTSTSSSPSSGPLPRTGTGAFGLVALGIALIGAGVGLTRRQRIV
jgi:LPXTG-motif cell wall-anchored protein